MLMFLQANDLLFLCSLCKHSKIAPMQMLVDICQAGGFLSDFKIEESESWGQVVCYIFLPKPRPEDSF